MDKFKVEYERLNSAQKEAVDTIEGPVMVVAGPGTGKTQVLTLRIANILLKTDTAPEQILALTFTDAASKNMRRRLSTLIGNRAYSVRISTFHSWCQDIIDTYNDSFPEIIESRTITDADKIELIDKIMDDLNLPLLKRNGTTNAYTKDVSSAISELKREGIIPEHFREIVEKSENEDKKLVDKNHDLSAIYLEYEKRLRETKRYDFDDMIVEVLKAIKSDGDLRLRLQEEYQYVHIDEHQDTNNAQNVIIETLMSFHENPNLFVVGDEKQAIFRFQGATLENFYYFRDHYKDAKLIKLTENYRSHSGILDVAGSLLGKDTLTTQNKSKEKDTITYAILPTSEIERYYVAKEIKKLIDQGTKKEEIAIIYRDNKYGNKMSDILSKFEIPHRVEGKEDLLREPDVASVLVVLQSIYEFGLDTTLAPLILLPISGISPIDSARILRYANDNWRDNIGIWDVLNDKKLLQSAKVGDIEKVENLVSLLNRLHSLSNETDLYTYVETVYRESGILKRATDSKNVLSRFATIRSFMKIVEETCQAVPEAKLSDLFRKIETMRRHGLAYKRNIARKEGYVRLMTAHGAKGLEFEHVFILHAMDGIWGGRRSMEKVPILPEVFSQTGVIPEEDPDSDERRLFYVAITRAKKTITITESERDDTERERAPSRFVTEIDTNLLFKPELSQIEKEYEENAPHIFAKQKQTISTMGEDIDASYVRELFEEEGLSATALNNYLDCPLRYYYRNLLRLPEAREAHLFYGSAMHKAIERYVKRRKDEDVSDSYLLTSFEEALVKQPLPRRESEIYLEKGINALKGWLVENKENIAPDAIPEFDINKVELSKGLYLSGKLDRIDGVTTGSVHIVDYKTGSPKSRNHILGLTKDSDGNYYRQLVFYKLLLSLYKDGALKVKSSEINFLEPNDSGKYKKEEFVVSTEEVEELKNTILKIQKEICDMSFLQLGCGKDDCEYCKLQNN